MTHRNADTRIREAFDALRAELRDIYGEPHECNGAYWQDRSYFKAWTELEMAQNHIHRFAKLPADA